MAVWLDLHTISCTARYKCCPNGSPAIIFTSGQQEFEKQTSFGEGPCKAELGDRNFGQLTSFEHSDADQALNIHVHHRFLMEGSCLATMPGGGLYSVFEITAEYLDIPTHVIEVGQF